MVRRARQSLDMTMYELADPNLERQLVGAWERGVAVRILLDRAGGGASVNQAAFDTLHSRGVPVRWAPGSVDFHQKTLTADQTESAIMTGNLTSSYYPTTRDFVVVDRIPAAVRSIELVFNHDWNGATTTRVRPVAGLVWSPGARATLVAFINSARHTLAVENEEMASPAIIAALKAAGRRGVVVTVTMTANPAWTTAWRGLTRSGVQVATYPATPTALYIHAKAMVADGTMAFVGSQISPSTVWPTTGNSGSSRATHPSSDPWPRPWPPTSPVAPGSGPPRREAPPPRRPPRIPASQPPPTAPPGWRRRHSR